MARLTIHLDRPRDARFVFHVALASDEDATPREHESEARVFSESKSNSSSRSSSAAMRSRMPPATPRSRFIRSAGCQEPSA